MLLLVLAALAPFIGDPRYPSPSPDGTLLAFTWRGMLYLADLPGGEPRCVTPGEGYVANPEWSPDGRWIAFTSDASGGGDVYVMPAPGGESRRLTYHSGEDTVLGWEDDRVLFLSSREGGGEAVYSVPVAGGTPELRIPVPARSLALLEEGFILETGATPWWLRHYRGSASSSLWTGDRDDWTPLCPDSRDQRWPMVLNGSVYFVMEDGQGTDRFWTVSGGGSAEQVSGPFPGGITFPGAGGGLVAFESGGELLTAAPPDWRPDTLRFRGSVDLPFRPERMEVAGTYTDDFSVSPDGALIAAQAVGGIFVGALEDGKVRDDTRRLTVSQDLEQRPRWSPRGDALVYQRENGAGVSLVAAFGAPDPGFSTETLETGTLVARNAEWSPDGGMISFLDQDEALHVYDLASRRSIRVCDVRGVLHHSWSPDGRWLAFSAPWEAHREDVFVVSAAGGVAVNVSRHPNDDFQPLWPPDGRRLVWASRTDEGDYSIRQAWLRESDWNTENSLREDILEEASGDVSIDFRDIVRRVETLCTVRGWYDFYGLSADGKTVFLPGHDQDGRMDLWSVSWEGGDLSRLTWEGLEPTRIQTDDSGTVYFLSYGNTVRTVTPEGGAQGVLGWSCPFPMDLRALQAAKFDHAWRLLRDNFYDPGMHGADWDRLREYYRPRALGCLLNQDFNDVMRRMLGELSASHLGINGPWTYRSVAYTGELGVIPGGFAPGGGVAVDSVIPGSPAFMGEDRLLPGEVILSINGTPVGRDHNLYAPLQLSAGREANLEISGRGGSRTVTMEPTSTWRMWQLVYREGIARNRRIVAGLTGDRVGYLHIPAMNQESVEDFRRDLYAEGLDREAMIVDIRGNGGGSTHDQLLAALGREPYAESRGRCGRSTFEPLGVWRGPLVLLIDQTCYSDAEIFAAAWKELELGPVVGVPTYGAVIGTVDVSLADGTSFRLPGTGWYTLSGTNLENHGVQPDVLVPAEPSDFRTGTDRQLEAAVEQALEMLP